MDEFAKQNSDTQQPAEQAIKSPAIAQRKIRLQRIVLTIFLLVVSVIGILGYIYWQKIENGDPSTLLVTAQTQNQETYNKNNTDSDTPPLLLKSIGVNIDYYNPNTGKAGDFVFTRQELQFNSLFMDYGFFIPASSASSDKKNPQPTFILPLGTPVRSLVDGVVAQMPTLWSGDISIQVTTDGKLQRWIYEVEHVINPKVKVGDKVTAGQIIAEVSNFDKGAPAGFGAVEIGILHGGGEGPPEHVCPFAYLDPSIKSDLENKIKAFYKSWNEYLGKTIYDDSSYSTPGCLTADPIEG